MQDKHLSFSQQYDPVGQINQTNVVGPVAQAIFRRGVGVNLPSEFGDFELISYENADTNAVHLAIIHGKVKGRNSVPLRIHSSCVTGDVLGSLRCDCRQQLIKALEYIATRDHGMVIYAFQEGRGIGLANKLRAYYLQERGLDTVDANLALGLPGDLRKYDFAKHILSDLKVKSVALMTNNPDKVKQLTDLGISVSEIISHEVSPCTSNYKYLQTKREKMGHQLSNV